MAIDYPLWKTLKENIVTILEAVSVQEETETPGRGFSVSRDRWFPYIESQHGKALVNVMVQNVGIDAGRSASRMNQLDEINVFIDMYVIGEAGGVLPADEEAAQRLDLLTNQVRVAITSLAEIDLGFPRDTDYGIMIDWEGDVQLTVYDQDNEQSTGQYAPARWSFTVNMPYIPNDNNTYLDLETLAISLKTQTAATLGIQLDYTP